MMHLRLHILCWCMFLGVLAQAGEPLSVALEPRWRLASYPGMTAIEQAVLRRTNLERTRRKLPVVMANTALQLAARRHCGEMGQRSYFGHQSPVVTWRTPRQRAYLAGYHGQWVGENLIAMDPRRLRDAEHTAAYLIAEWLRSPHHRTNVLNPSWRHLGVAVVRVGNRVYAGQVFGASLVELECAVAERTSGDLLQLELTGIAPDDSVTLMVNGATVPQDSSPHELADIRVCYPRHSGIYVVELAVNHIRRWRAVLDTDSEDGEWLREIQQDEHASLTRSVVSLHAFDGLRVSGYLRGRAGITMLRDGVVLPTPASDARSRMPFDLILPQRQTPYRISVVVGKVEEDVLFIDTMRPLTEAFRGRPD